MFSLNNKKYDSFSWKTGNWTEPRVCRFFLNGNCRYGDYCRNSHAVQSDATATAPVQPIVDTTQPNDPNNNNSLRNSEAMRNWIDAPEFVPRYITQNNTSCDGDNGDGDGDDNGDDNTNQASCNDVQGASRLVHC